MYNSSYLSYRQTDSFAKIILDYVEQTENLVPFFSFPPDVKGIQQSIIERQNFKTDRDLLVKVLQVQYAEIDTSSQVKKNIELLTLENTFTICTAHQPNIFTGHLYFIYKILHAAKLAEYLNKHLPDNNFVPVFYMGSEDADLEELGHIYVNGKKYEWQTKQTGAVGRMSVDEGLIKLSDQISGQLSVLPYGEELINILQNAYRTGTTIQQATFEMINNLFRDYGLVVLLPDNADLKRSMLPVFEDDIFNNTPSEIVGKTSAALSKQYKVQAHPREINLFYLKDNIRNRITEKENLYYVEGTHINFTGEEIKEELNNYPERFSPNVILRGLYQETILPNLAFVGGGGELAYWLELKELFQHYKVPYPVLILRNSFLLINKSIENQCKKLQLGQASLFKEENILLNELVKAESTHQLYLSLEKQQVTDIYNEIKKAVKEIDTTLQEHTEALLTKALKSLEGLEKKMLKAEKRKFETQQRQIKKIKSELFPNGELQERIDNFMPYYAMSGKDFIKMVYDNSLTFQQKFCVLTEPDD